MKDLFYGILSFLIIFILYHLVNVPRLEYGNPQNGVYNGSIVIGKDNFLNYVVLYDTIRHPFLCDDIIFEKIELGDTVFFNQNGSVLESKGDK